MLLMPYVLKMSVLDGASLGFSHITTGEVKNETKKRVSSVYPNPATSFIKIDLEEVTENGYTIKIMNAMGEVVKSEQATEVKYSTSLDGLANGTYYIEIQADNFRDVQQLVIAR